MKRNIKYSVLCAAAVLSCMTVFPAYAETSKEDYKTQSEEIREECKDIKAQIDALKEENNEIMERYKALQSSVKESKELPESITKEEWKQITELRKQLNAGKEKGNSQTRESQKPAEGEKKNSAVKSAVQEENYDGALDSLNEHLENNRQLLERLQKQNEILKQIDDMIR